MSPKVKIAIWIGAGVLLAAGLWWGIKRRAAINLGAFAAANPSVVAAQAKQNIGAGHF